MREIKFRGLRTDGKGWAVGRSLIQAQIENREFVQIEQSIEHDFKQWEVHPETVGEFTGLHDKNGKEIFEGDVVTTVLEGGLTSKGFVRYNSDEWRFEVVDEIPDDEVRYFESIEVIGNIHETQQP